MTDEQFLGLLLTIGGGMSLIMFAIHEAADIICEQIERVIKRND